MPGLWLWAEIVEVLFKLQYREWCDLQTCVGLFIIYYRDVGLGHILICLVADTFHPSRSCPAAVVEVMVLHIYQASTA